MHLLTPDQSIRRQFMYSNLGWTVAGQVLSAVAGQEWCDYLHKRVWGPLGMTSTYCSRNDVPIDVAAKYYAQVCIHACRSPGWRACPSPPAHMCVRACMSGALL